MQTEKQRERLVELIKNADNDKNLGWYDLYDLCSKDGGCAEYFADYLMSNNVVVLPCKVDGSQKVYYPMAKTSVIYETRVWALGVDENGDMVINPIEYNAKAFSMSGVEFGKTVFLSRAEAENVLKERKENVK